MKNFVGSNFNLLQNIHTDPNSPSGRIGFANLVGTAAKFNLLLDSQKESLTENLLWLSKNYPQNSRNDLLIENNKLAAQVSEDYKDKFSYLGKKIILQLPEKANLKNRMQNWYETLNHMGIQTNLLSHERETREQFNEFDPDVFITFDDNSNLNELNTNTINEWRKFYGMKLGVILSYDEPAEQGDFAITFHRNPERHKKLTESKIPLISLPFAINPLKHFMRPGRELWDYFFVGINSSYKKRETEQYLTPILKNYNGILAGMNWNKGLTELDPNDASLYYSFAKICPNYHVTRQLEEYNEVNERTFIIPACGGFQLVDNPIAMKECFDEDEMCVALSPYEYKDKFRYFLEKEEERTAFVKKGMMRVFKEHTLFHVLARFAEFLEQMPEESKTAESTPELVIGK